MSRLPICCSSNSNRLVSTRELSQFLQFQEVFRQDTDEVVIDAPGTMDLTASITCLLAERISHLDELRMNPILCPTVIT